jgi:hypothetical protein
LKDERRFQKRSLHCCYIYSIIFTVPTCTTTIISLEHCAALNDEFQHLYPYLIKFHYFADTTERGDRGAKAEEIKE